MRYRSHDHRVDRLCGRRNPPFFFIAGPTFTAIRLSNGNTLVNLTHGNKTVESDADGRVVWKVSNDDFPAQKPFADPCGGQRLPYGNTVIASYGSSSGIKVFEVTREKQIVWTYTGPHRAHEIQILTTNGQPFEGPPLK